MFLATYDLPISLARIKTMLPLLFFLSASIAFKRISGSNSKSISETWAGIPKNFR